MHDSEFLPDDPTEEPATLEDENLSLYIGGVLYLVGNGGLDALWSASARTGWHWHNVVRHRLDTSIA